jgi:uncharacterized phage-associated protein
MSARYRATTIAKWFVAWAQAEEADLSNLKLQKLLYYAQGHHLATVDEPLFNDPIQAWSHGPVVPSVYHEFKASGSKDIQLSESDPFRWEDVDEQTTDLLMRVWNTYGGLAAWRLRNMTHEEEPWKAHFRDDERHLVIPREAIADYFKRVHQSA